MKLKQTEIHFYLSLMLMLKNPCCQFNFIVIPYPFADGHRLKTGPGPGPWTREKKWIP